MTRNNSLPTALAHTLARARQLFSARRRAYAAGNRALNKGDLGAAEHLIRRSLANGNHPASWLQRLGLVQERAHKYQEALSTYYAAITEDSNRAEWYYRAGACAKHLGNITEALELFEHALTKDSQHTRAANALAASIPSTTPGWRKRELLQRAICVSPQAETLRDAAKLAYSMHNYDETIAHLDAIRDKDLDEKADTILLARALVRLDETKRAHLLLRSLSVSDSDPKARSVGPGYYADRHEEWELAFKLHEAEWETRAATQPQAAFGAAYALDRQYFWEASLEWYERALQSDLGTKPYWNYKYAHALERTERYELAAQWYSRALSLGQKQQWDWYYRLGYCHSRSSQHEQAYLSLRTWATQSVRYEGPAPFTVNPATPSTSIGPLEDALDTFNASLDGTAEHLALELQSSLRGPKNVARRELAKARLALRRGQTDQAVAHYRACLRANIVPNAPTAVEVADLLYATMLLEEAVTVLLDLREFSRPDGLDPKRLITSSYERRKARYAEYCDRFAIVPNTVLFETYWGTRISDNPLALYRHLVTDPRFNNHVFYWVYQSTTQIPEALQDDGRTILVEYGTQQYDRVLAATETLINNTSFVEYFQRRKTQRYINTWHGTPLKTLGKRIRTGVLEHANVSRNLMQTSLLALPNIHTANTLLHDYGVYGITQSAATVTGSPRLDELSGEPSVASRLHTREQLGIPPADRRRIVFYAPTWRGSATHRSQDNEIAHLALDTIAEDTSVIPVFRAHHLVETELENLDDRVIVAPQKLNTYDILEAADVLVTDYSSLLVDFLVTGRQAIAFVPDLAEYRSERGLYLDPNTLVSDCATDAESLRGLLSHKDFNPDAKYLASRDRLCGLEDGDASRRIADYICTNIVEGENLNARPAQQTVVFCESMIPNGIRSSFISLCNKIDPDRYRFVVVLDVNQVEHSSDRQHGLASLPPHVEVVGRTGQMLQTLEERYAVQQSSRRFGDIPKPLDAIVDSAYKREFRRIFGQPQPGTIFIDFEGYSRFWNALFGRGIPESASNGVVLHNQMDLEREARFPYLAEIIRNYRHYNGISSVATAISDDNHAAARHLDVPLKVIPTVLHNTIDTDKIVAAAGNGVSHWDSFPDAYPKIVTAARLSPEKNQSLMIEAMRTLVKTHSSAKLIILGDGPSMSTLRSQVHNYELDDVVHFAGFERNPMPTIKDSDVFVLTSKHEGQPMVIFEAMVLGLPVVTTPVPGCVEALGFGSGAITEYDAGQVAEDIISVLKRSEPVSFDHDAYNLRALEEFDQFIGLLSEANTRS